MATKNPLEMMTNAFYFALKALYLLKIFKFLSWHLDNVEEKRLDWVNLKIYDATNWETNNWNTHIVQYLEK